MASEADHISLANRNHAFLLHLLEDGSYLDWAATVAFYKAVHVVEAVIAHDLHTSSMSHNAREQILKTPRFKQIYKNYAHLYTASRIARYLEDRGTGKFSTFADYMNADDVNLLVRKRLYGVEHHALGFLSDVSRAALTKIDPSKIQ